MLFRVKLHEATADLPRDVANKLIGLGLAELDQSGQPDKDVKNSEQEVKAVTPPSSTIETVTPKPEESEDVES